MMKIWLIICLTLANLAHADDKQSLAEWKRAFKIEAIEAGISKKTVYETLKRAKYLPKVIALDRSQPEFISTFVDYLNRRVNNSNIARGKSLMQAHQTMLDQVEQTYQVPAQVLVAFWGMETHYGVVQGDFGLPSALMTLAYEGRRANFFRNELINLMRIIDEKHYPAYKMRGSWAGAFGHMQFMPTTFVNHGIDADQDGRVNIWTSLPDAFYSAANYLKKTGWRQHEPIAVQVMLPKGFDYSLAHLKNRQSVAHWTQLGVQMPAELHTLDNAAILLPQGWQGPALMVFSNFDVVMEWNRSVNYALAVAHLANQMVDGPPLNVDTTIDEGALSFNQMWALQGKLNELGFDCGKPDGYPGLKTQESIRQYQATQQLPQDGYASPSLYHRLLNH